MGEEDYPMGRRWCVSFGGSGEDDDESVRMMDESKICDEELTGVEGEWVKRALIALIRPSSHQLRQQSNFEPMPSRLYVMSKANDL
ncbi:hypothetical protein CFP56_025426 [Quercus suber]|uniref:Uncharacterized protein n=1 Tax=Quercus suber TaxID=58331 RepID=A0AAW0LXR3_QUESU